MSARPSAPRARSDADRLFASLPARPAPVARPALAVLTGLPGTGKSTLGRQLAAAVPLLHLETDVLRRVLFPRPAYTPTENARLFLAIHRLIDRLLADGLPLLLDGTNLAEAARRRLRGIADRRDAPFVMVRTAAPEGVVRARLARRVAGRNATGRRDPDDASDATWDTYERMRGNEEPVRQDHRLVETSGDISAVVRELADELRQVTRGDGPSPRG